MENLCMDERPEMKYIMHEANSWNLRAALKVITWKARMILGNNFSLLQKHQNGYQNPVFLLKERQSRNRMIGVAFSRQTRHIPPSLCPLPGLEGQAAAESEPGQGWQCCPVTNSAIGGRSFDLQCQHLLKRNNFPSAALPNGPVCTSHAHTANGKAKMQRVLN